jgi:hypothetical protein
LVLDGQPYPAPEVAVHFVAELIEANGRSVSFAGWLKQRSDFERARLDRVMVKLDPRVLELIERGGKGKPYRLLVDKLV